MPAGKFDETVAQAAAIDLHGRVLAAEDRNVLVHDAAGHAHEVALRALAEAGQSQRIELAAGQQGQCGGDFQRGRRTQARAFRHGAADQQVGGRDGEARAHQFLRHADGVIGPMPRRVERAEIGRVPLAHLLAEFGIDAQLAVRAGGRRGDIGGQIERHRQHEPQVVIGVLADQVDAARRAKDAHAFRRAVQLAEVRCHEALREARHASNSMNRPNTSIASAAVQVDVGIGQCRARVRRENAHPQQDETEHSEKPARRHS